MPGSRSLGGGGSFFSVAAFPVAAALPRTLPLAGAEEPTPLPPAIKKKIWKEEKEDLRKEKKGNCRKEVPGTLPHKTTLITTGLPETAAETVKTVTETGRKRSSAKDYFIWDGPNKAPILSSFGLESLTSREYQLSPAEDLTLAISLVRPLPPFMNDVKLLTEQTAVTKNKNGRVSKVYIISEKDNLLTEDMQRWIIECTGPYAEVIVIKDSDHMVLFSKPEKLSSELLKIAAVKEESTKDCL
uniref:Esterase PIR7B n=1 Tax=Cajanus cajan TaxID=3821 RepID=A0A151RVG6_CAJCA|nr:Esterase PIR7B [Cajanus cajan]